VVAPRTIIDTVTEDFQINLSEIKGPRRHRHVTIPRQVAMYLIRELTDASLPVIGSLFGGRDHTTVINALKRIESLRSADPDLRRRIDSLKTRLEG
jgi:chromosomal replication initiator protein